MKKKLFTALLATLLLASVITGVLLSSDASGTEVPQTFDPSTYNYDDLYVKEGLISWYDAFSAKEGDAVTGTLTDKSGNGNDFTLSKLNSAYETTWTFGDGYLQISTGSKLTLNDVFTIPAVGETTNYTVEYIFSTLDEEPMGATPKSGKFVEYGLPFAQEIIGAFNIGGFSLNTLYINRENRAILEKMATDYQKALANPLLQPNYSVVLPEGNEAAMTTFDANADGKLDFAEVTALLDHTYTSGSATRVNRDTTYYPFTQDYSKFIQNGIGKTMLQLNSNWAADIDWKSSSTEFIRMGENDSRTWFLTLSMTGTDTGTQSVATMYKDGTHIGSYTKTGTPSTGIVLQKDLAARVYGIRVYNRTLTDDELKTNHIADVLKFYQLDPSFYLDADPMHKSLYEGTLTSIKIGTATKEEVNQLIADADKQLVMTEKNEYTDLYVQDGLLFMVNPMTSTVEREPGAAVLAVSDLNGNTYNIAGGATWTGTGINLGTGISLSFGNVLPTTGEYSVHFMYAHSDATLGTTSTASRVNFLIGPSEFRISYANPADDVVAGGITKGWLYMAKQDGGLTWKRDFDTSWGSFKQPDLFAEPYGTFNVFSNNMLFNATGSTVTIIKDGHTVGSSTGEYWDGVPSRLQFGPYFDKDFYGVLVYDRPLTDEEMIINHFANLMAYYKVDMTSFSTIVDNNVKARLYNEFANTRVGETTTEYLQSVLDNFAITGGVLGVIKAEDYIGFAGVQSRIKDYASARGLFYISAEKLKQLEDMGCLVEYGVLMAEAADDRSAQDLTLVLNRALGEYVPTKDYVTASSSYRHGELTEQGLDYVKDGKLYFSATIPAVEMDDLDATAVNREYYMRGYIIIDVGGSSFVFYADSTSLLFGDSVSIAEAATYFLYSGFAESDVLAGLCGKYAAAGANAALEAFKHAENAYITAETAASLIKRAYEGAVTARGEYTSFSAAISVNMALSDAMHRGPLAASAKTQSLIYAAAGLEKYLTASEQILAAREYAEQISTIAYNAAVAAGAGTEEAELIRTQSSEKILLLIADVEAYLATNESMESEFNTILNAYSNDMNENKLQQVVGAKSRLTINNKTISNYMIVTDTDHMVAAEALQRMILKRFGSSIGIYNIDNPYIGDHYDYTQQYAIFVGITDGELQAADGDQIYSIYGEGRCVFIEGNTVESVEAGAAVLVQEIAGKTGRVQITLDRADNSYMNEPYAPLVSFNHQDTYPAVTISSYDAMGIWEVFRQKVAELETEISVVPEKNPTDFAGSTRVQYYVATDGNDSNAGTIDAPFATLQKALDMIAYESGSIIWVRGGIYTLNATPELKAAHNGTVASPTFISAYPGETVTFTAADQVDASSLLTIDQAIATGLIDASIKTRLNTFTAGNHKNVYVTKLDEHYTIDTAATAALYVNNQPYHISRYPNAGVTDEANGITNGRISFSNTKDGTADDIRKVGNVTTNTSDLYAAHKTESGGWELYYDDALYADRINQYNLKDTQLKTYAAVYQEWHRARYNLTLHTDDSNGRQYMKSAEACQWGAKESGGNNMYFYNIIEELDAQNEYYVDQNNRLMYIWSETSLADAELLYCSKATSLMTVTGAANIIIKDIVFTKTKTTAVTAKNNENVIFQGCSFSDITGSSISMTAGKKCGLLACDLSNSTSCMAYVQGDLTVLKSTHNFVQNCYFHDPNELTQTALTMGGIGDIISHNLFKHCTLTTGGSYECIIEYNEFDGASQITYDSGPIYCSGPGSKNSIHIRYNLFHNLNISRYGIYLDDLSAGNYVYCNIVEYAEENSGGGKCVNIHSGTQNVVYNNIGLRATEAGFRDNYNYYVKTIDGVGTGGGGLSYRWEPMAASIASTYSTRVYNWGEETYKARYPMAHWYGKLGLQHYTELQARDDWNSDNKVTGIDDLELFLREPSHNVYVNNVMYDCGANLQKGWAICELGASTTYFANNLAFTSNNEYALCSNPTTTPQFADAGQDIGFVDSENDNYSFKADSIIYTLIPDFEEVYFDRMGRIQDLKVSE